MYSYEQTPNLKSKSYRLLDDGVEVARNLSKKTASLMCLQINKLQNTIKELSYEIHQTVNPEAQIQQRVESIDIRANFGVDLCTKQPRTNESSIGTDVPETTGNTVGITGSEKESSINRDDELSGQKNQELNQFFQKRVQSVVSGTKRGIRRQHELAERQHELAERQHEITEFTIGLVASIAGIDVGVNEFGAETTNQRPIRRLEQHTIDVNSVRT